MKKKVETKVLLTPEEDEKLQELATRDGRSKTSFCTNEIKKIIKKVKI